MDERVDRNCGGSEQLYISTYLRQLDWILHHTSCPSGGQYVVRSNELSSVRMNNRSVEQSFRGLPSGGLDLVQMFKFRPPLSIPLYPTLEEFPSSSSSASRKLVSWSENSLTKSRNSAFFASALYPAAAVYLTLMAPSDAPTPSQSKRIPSAIAWHRMSLLV